MSELSREQVETTISRFLSWHACDSACDHDLNQVLATDAALRVKLKAMEQNREDWRACSAAQDRLHDRMRELLAASEHHLEQQRTATYQAVEREHAAKKQLAEAQATIARLENLQIATRCPSCNHSTLFVASGNWLTCSLIGCKDPTLINSLADRYRCVQQDYATLETKRDHLQATVTAQQEEIGRLRAVIDVSKPTYSIRPSFRLDPDALASGKETA